MIVLLQLTVLDLFENQLFVKRSLVGLQGKVTQKKYFLVVL